MASEGLRNAVQIHPHRASSLHTALRKATTSGLILVLAILGLLTSLMSTAAITIQPASIILPERVEVDYLQTWYAKIDVSPIEIHIIPGQRATFTVTVSLTSHANVDVRFLVVWLKLIQLSGGSQLSIVSKDFRSGPISGTPTFQAILTLQSTSTTPLGLRLFHIIGSDSMQHLSSCPTPGNFGIYCGDSGYFGVYVDSPPRAIASNSTTITTSSGAYTASTTFSSITNTNSYIHT